MSLPIIRPTFTRQDERGTLHEILNGGEWRSVVQGEMNVGAVMGNHYHQKTLVFFFLLSGHARVITLDIHSREREQFDLTAMEGVIFPVNVSHSVTFIEHGQYLMLKSLPYDPQNPDTYAYPVE
jgi:dTDP-4-dehydrorhamnose 3,5-epimerase-like enzyme